jgi:choline dehydrogenase-like flavoprotein
MKQEADVIVVGSGAAGATIARELSRSGMDVLLLEKGAYHHRLLGTHVSAALMADRMGMRFSKEGLQCVRAITTGGSTLLTCGTFREPAPFIREKLGIDLSSEIEETRRDLGVSTLPERLLEGSSLMLLDAANRLGYRWEPLEKFIDPKRCREGCSACMMGCPCDAKWTARRFIKDALSQGATLIQKVSVDRVIQENGRVKGVLARKGWNTLEFRAPIVILAAGGMGSAPILKRSGIENAGKGIFIDPLVLVSGYHPGDKAFSGTCYNPPMSVGTWDFYGSEGFMLAPLIDPWLLYLFQLAMVSPSKIFSVFRYRRIMSIMTKIKDDMAGEVYEDGSFSKPLTELDNKKLNRGAEISTEILCKAGCPKKSLARTPVRGAHPGGACRIGDVLNSDLETEIGNLYVSDASIFPEALGTPVVATLVAMNKRLSKHILALKNDRKA